MPRNSSGIYQLPAGNPVVTGTLIESDWANVTMADIAQALTNSLDRLGSSTMAAPLLINDGTISAPGLAFGAEASTGLYRKSAKVLGVSVGGVDVATFTQTGVSLPLGIIGGLSGKGTTSGTWSVGAYDAALGGLALTGAMATDTIVAVNPTPLDGAGQSLFNVFPQVTTTGNRQLRVYRGDGTATIDHVLSGGNSGLMAQIARSGGRTLIGTGTDNTIDTLQVALSARVRGGASGVPNNAAALAGYDEFVIEGAGAVGMSFLSPNTASCGIAWGDPQGPGQGFILYNHVTDQMQLGAAASANLILDAAYTRSTLPVYLPDGTAAVPALAFTSQGTWGLWRIPSFGLGFGVNGVEIARMYNNGVSGGPVVGVGITGAAQWAAANRGVVEINGANESLLGMCAAGAKVGYLQGTAANFSLGSQVAAPIRFVTNGTEAARITAAAQGELLVNILTAGSQSLANRGLVYVDGTAGGLVTVGYGGAAKAYFVSRSGNASLGSYTGSPLLFEYNGGEVARIATDSTLQYGGIEVGYRGILWTAKASGSYVFVGNDAGKAIRLNSGATGATINQSVFSAGDVVTVFNMSGGLQTITQGTSVSLRFGTGTPGTGNRTLANNGLATLYCVDGSTFILTGTGIV